MRYLLGESLGGAVALLLHRKKPDFWDGAVLVAPMCKVTLYIMSSSLGIHPLSSLSDYFLFFEVTSSFGSFSLHTYIYIYPWSSSRIGSSSCYFSSPLCFFNFYFEYDNKLKRKQKLKQLARILMQTSITKEERFTCATTTNSTETLSPRTFRFNPTSQRSQQKTAKKNSFNCQQNLAELG